MVKIFIGSSSNGEDAPIEAVYEHTLRQNCPDIEINWMRQERGEYWSGYQSHTWPTPFSGFRWVIAEACDFKGRAIYTDCDMINFRSMEDLYNIDMQGKPLAARKGTRFGGHEFCVMVIDCEKFKEHAIPASRVRNISETHQRMINKFSGNDALVHELDPKWNCLDGENYDLDDIYQLHFTNMATQPWQPSWYTGEPQRHPRDDVVDLFYEKVEAAKNAGYAAENYELKNDKELLDYGIIGR
jgi:lipopolysaccharide biosynthesis glycosyltransferase